MSQGYNVKINLFFASISQVLTLVFALVVPKLLINYYGPQIHGLTATISSLISYLTLVESGIGAASVQSLYAPLQERDYKLVNADLNAIAIFYLRIGKIFVTLVIVIATLYPFLSADGLDYWLVFTLVLISGLANTIEYFFTSKYRVLLQADKKLYVINLVNSVGILLQGILRIVFIYLKMSIFVVQLVPAIVYAVRLISISVYVNRAYSYLDRTVSPNFQVGKKRWSALIHQISNIYVYIGTIMSAFAVFCLSFKYKMQGQNFLTIMGEKYSTYIFVLHGLVIKGVNKLNLFIQYECWHWIKPIVIIFISIGASIILRRMSLAINDYLGGELKNYY